VADSPDKIVFEDDDESEDEESGYTNEDELEEEEECSFSDFSETDMDEVRKALFQRLTRIMKGPIHRGRDDDSTWNLMYNEFEIISEAFDLATTRLLGEGHGIQLVI
jgi:hypothetical protein